MDAPSKRRVGPGGRRPPPALRRPPAPLGPLPADRLDRGHGQHRWSPAGQVEHLGQTLRAWRRGGNQPVWVRRVGWLVVISFLAPLALGAWRALLG